MTDNEKLPVIVRKGKKDYEPLKASILETSNKIVPTVDIGELVIGEKYHVTNITQSEFKTSTSVKILLERSFYIYAPTKMAENIDAEGIKELIENGIPVYVVSKPVSEFEDKKNKAEIKFACGV